MKDWIRVGTTVLLLSVALDCHKDDLGPGDGSGDTGLTGPGVFTSSPLKLSDLVATTPLGNLYPPDHTLPTGHVVFYYVDPSNRRPGDKDTMRTVYAPGDGILVNIYSPNPITSEGGIEVKMTETFSYSMYDLLVLPGLAVGQRVTAGMPIATTSPASNAVDFEVENTEVTLTGFVRPERYPAKMLHHVAPYGYFSRPLQDSLYAKNRRNSPDKDGRIDYDIPGRLVGNWFLEGLPDGESSVGQAAGTKQISIVYDMFEPTSVRISIGGTLSVVGLFGVDGLSPDPATVSASQSLVVYRFVRSYIGGTPAGGGLLAQVLTGDRLKVETYSGNTPPAGFTAGAVVFTR
jgi:hypothetical protein